MIHHLASKSRCGGSFEMLSLTLNLSLKMVSRMRSPILESDCLLEVLERSSGRLSILGYATILRIGVPSSKDKFVKSNPSRLLERRDIFPPKQDHSVMPSSEGTNMVFKSYQSQVEMLLQNYVHADPFILCASVISSMFACKLIYDLSQLISPVYFKSYSSLAKSKQIEWNNRVISTFHAVFIATMSLYLILCSDLYSDNQLRGPITLRSSKLSTSALGVSVGYFIMDLGMILWFYPSLGGMEYVIHHLLSMTGATYAMLTGEAQVYTFMVLISEATTPSINLRWYLDETGMKRSRAYTINGIVMFLAWLVARILVFVYLFYHAYLHYNQVKQMRVFGRRLVLVIPSVLTVMNLIWFWKILKGLKKTLAKRH